MDAGEAVDVTLEREVAEETGLQIRDLHGAGAVEGEMEQARFAALMMKAVAEHSEVKLSQEHEACTWATRRGCATRSFRNAAFIKRWAESKSNVNPPYE